MHFLKWKYKNPPVYIILLFIIAASLFSSDIFIYKSLTSYFFYLIGISIFLVYAGAISLLYNKHAIPLPRPILAALLTEVRSTICSYAQAHGWTEWTGCTACH